MNREQYVAALSFCYEIETVGAIAGELAMLQRADAAEKRKLDVFRRLEASNKRLCAEALKREGVAYPNVEARYYRNAVKLAQKLGKGDWDDFLDRFEATIHPDVFAAYLYNADGREIDHEYENVDVPLLQHLLRHEQSLVEFVLKERHGGGDSTRAMERLLNGKLCGGLVGPDDPVGW